MTFHEMVPLVPVIFAIHTAEEAPRMAAWSTELRGRFHPPVTTAQFAIAAALLTAVVVAVAGWAYLRPTEAVPSSALLEVQAAIAFNVLVPHVALFVRQRRYNPGLLSAVLCSAPFSVAFFRTALAAGLVRPGGLALMFVLAPAVMIGAAFGALRVGQVLVARSPAG